MIVPGQADARTGRGCSEELTLFSLKRRTKSLPHSKRAKSDTD